MSERNNQGFISIPIANIYGFTTAIYNAVAYIASALGFVPATDNTLMLGTSTQRWAETHTANINTSAGENTTIGNDTGVVTIKGTVVVPFQTIVFSTATAWTIAAGSQNFVPVLSGITSSAIPNGTAVAPFTHSTNSGAYSSFTNTSSATLLCKVNVYTLADSAASGSLCGFWFRGNGSSWTPGITWLTLQPNQTSVVCESIVYIPAGTGFVFQTWNGSTAHPITCSNTEVRITVL